MTPADYVNEIVVPTVREFRDEPRCRRRLYLACMVTFHIKDYLKEAGESQPEYAIRATSDNADDDFQVVRAVCNGTKHVVLRPPRPYPFVAGDDWDRPPLRAGEGQAGISRAGDVVGGREIAVGTGRGDLYQRVKRVVGGV
jgi:hypothetical protein